MSRELFTEVYKRRIDLVGVVQVLPVELGVLQNTLYMSGSGLLKNRRIDLVGIVIALPVEPVVVHNTLYMSREWFTEVQKDRSSRSCPSTPSRTRSQQPTFQFAFFNPTTQVKLNIQP